MGSMKDKRRKKLKKAWNEFQLLHELSDEDTKLARQTGYSIKQLQDLLEAETTKCSMSTAQRIQELRHEQLQKNMARQADIQAGLIEPKVKQPRKKKPLDPKWAKAKAACRLNLDDIRKARELGLNPQSLIKNIPAPAQQWKAPVKIWIRELHAKRFGSQEEAAPPSNSGMQKHARTPVTDDAASNHHSVGTHDRIVRDWEQNAERNDEENYEFLRSLKYQDYGFDVDRLAGELHQAAFQMIDCTRCANCCRTKQPKLDDSDVQRIAAYLNMNQAEFVERFLEPNPDDPPYRTRETPCPFLGDDNRCTVYEVRPTVCSEYPYTDKNGLVFRTMGVANNALVCPAVFWIVEQMKQQSGNRHDDDSANLF